MAELLIAPVWVLFGLVKGAFMVGGCIISGVSSCMRVPEESQVPVTESSESHVPVEEQQVAIELTPTPTPASISSVPLEPGGEEALSAGDKFEEVLQMVVESSGALIMSGYGKVIIPLTGIMSAIEVARLAMDNEERRRTIVHALQIVCRPGGLRETVVGLVSTDPSLSNEVKQSLATTYNAVQNELERLINELCSGSEEVKALHLEAKGANEFWAAFYVPV